MTIINGELSTESSTESSMVPLSDTTFVVSRLQMLAMETIMRDAQRQPGGNLDMTINPAIDNIKKFIEDKTTEFILANYVELLFRSSLIGIAIKLSEGDAGTLSYSSKKLLGSCKIQFITDKNIFDARRDIIEDPTYDGEDMILVFEENSRVELLKEKISAEYDKVNKGMRSTKDFIHDLMRKLPREFLSTMGIEFVSTGGDKNFSTQILGLLDLIYREKEKLTKEKIRKRK